jgi:RNA polymerase sigma-70 factor (ECF subfamily)
MSKTSKPTPYAFLPMKELIGICAGARDDDAWQEFVARVGKPISAVITRTASMWGNNSRSLVEDLIQTTYLKLWESGCHLLQEFAVERPEAILGYLKKTAANTTHDHFKHHHSQTLGGGNPHVSTTEIEPEIGQDGLGSQEKVAFGVFLKEIDEHLQNCLTGPDRERDRTIFWLYFKQGMSTKEIASLPGINLSTKGVGSVIERLKSVVRDQILGTGSNSGAEQPPKANSAGNSY